MVNLAEAREWIDRMLAIARDDELEEAAPRILDELKMLSRSQLRGVVVVALLRIMWLQR